MAAKKGNNGFVDRRQLTPLERFRSYCRFEPETGCVIWTGGTTCGRGNHIPYGSFWAEGRRWFAHRWAAKHIHGLDIDNFHVDHYCPNIPTPNTLCVQHLRCLTPRDNSVLMHERRRAFIYMQVGLLRYEDVYGQEPGITPLDESMIPFHQPPTWLGMTKGKTDDLELCPF